MTILRRALAGAVVLVLLLAPDVGSSADQDAPTGEGAGLSDLFTPPPPKLAPGTGPFVPARIARSAKTLRRLDVRVRRVSRQVRGYERIAAELKVWFRCVSLIGVDQVGDRRHRWGFVYDERDGTGLDTRTALVRRVTPGRPDLALLRMSRRAVCRSAAPDPNGTGEDARVALSPRASRATSRRHGARTLRTLERRLSRVEVRINRAERAFDRFDEWESCLSWLPVTEYGDEFQNLGYLFDDRPAPADGEQGRVAAIDIDSSEWDDPDYMLLAFLGTDRPFTHTECGHEPGEAVDRTGWYGGRAPALRAPTASTYASRLKDLRGDLAAADEDIEDLLEPAQEFVQFDECMFTIGVQERGAADHGYRYVRRDGAMVHRPALAFDLSTPRLPQLDVMGFPGEEPPQIECNEDAGGQDTDE